MSGQEICMSKIKKVKRKKDIPPDLPKLWEIKVTGKGGDADPKSGIKLIPESVCEACGLKDYTKFTDGIIVDENNWDGSDFFTVNGYPMFFLVTERVKDFIIKKQYTNCIIVKSRDLIYGI